MVRAGSRTRGKLAAATLVQPLETSVRSGKSLPCTLAVGFVALLLMAPLFPCAAAGQEAEEAPAPAATISGRVTMADSSTPVAGALVLLRKDSGGADDALSDAQGRFSFKSMGPGSYKLTATKIGYAP